MADDRVLQQCRAALQASIEGSLGLLRMSRQLLARMEQSNPLTPEDIVEYRGHLDSTEEQLHLMQAIIDEWLVASPPTQLH